MSIERKLEIRVLTSEWRILNTVLHTFNDLFYIVFYVDSNFGGPKILLLLANLQGIA